MVNPLEAKKDALESIPGHFFYDFQSQRSPHNKRTGFFSKPDRWKSGQFWKKL